MRHPVLQMLRELMPGWRRPLLAALTGAAALSSAVGLTVTAAWLISRAAEHPPVLELSVAVVLTRTFGLGRGVLRYVERLTAHDLALRGAVALRERLYRGLVAADPARVAGLRRGDLLARFGADVDTLTEVVVRGALPFGAAGATGLLWAGLSALVLPVSGLVLLGAGALAIGLAPWLAAGAAQREESDAAGARAAMSSTAQALLDSLGELLVAGAAERQLTRVAELDRTLTGRLDRAARPAALAAAVGTGAMVAAAVANLLLGASAVAGGAMAAHWLAALVLGPLALSEAIAGLPAAAVALVRSRLAAQRLLDLLDGAPAEPASALDPPPSAPAGIAPVRLTARGLAWGWPGQPPCGRGLDLDLPPGHRLAVVGPSGAGKTTLLLTLAGLLPARAGAVLLGQPERGGRAGLRELDEWGESAVRRGVSFTAQDAHLFTATLRENLRLAAWWATDAELLAVLDQVGLGEWAAGLPAGLDTELAAGGADLSGGQRRRLLVARALLTGAGAVLLDEPTEHLPAHDADHLVARLADVLPGQGRTLVIASHSAAALAEMDEVLVIQPGGRIRRGAPKWLAQHDPWYAGMVAAGEEAPGPAPRVRKGAA